MDQQGQVLRSGRVPNLQSEIERFLEGLKALEAVIETGRSSYAMMDILETMGVAVKIARETNIFSVKGRKMLLGLDLARDEKRLLEALLKT